MIKNFEIETLEGVLEISVLSAFYEKASKYSPGDLEFEFEIYHDGEYMGLEKENEYSDEAYEKFKQINELSDWP